MYNGDLGNADTNRHSLQSINDESQMQNHKDNAISNLPQIESSMISNPILKSPIISKPLGNSPESLIPQLQSSLETANLVNDNSNNDTTNKNGCAIAIQVDEDYEDEENEDEISETVALTQKFDKNRTKKN